MKNNPLYSGEPNEWEKLTLYDQLRYLKLHLCTGPMGASVMQGRIRERIRKALESAMDNVVRP